MTMSGLKPPKIFGDGSATFEMLLKYEREKYPHLKIEVPLVISRCLDFLMYKGLNAEGLFRVPGNKETLEVYMEEFNAGRGDSIDFLKKDELPENVASLLKQYLREMPDRPLFTQELSPDFCGLVEIQDECERVKKYWHLVEKIPPVNQLVVKKLLFYLCQVAANASTNKMGANALSIVFGQMAGVFADKGYELVNWLIDKYADIYEKTALATVDEPFFLRKLVGHPRSVIRLIQEGNFVFSFDSTGNVRIWDALNTQFYRTFDTNIKHSSKPIIIHRNIYFIDQATQTLKSWKVADALDRLNESPQCQSLKLGMMCPTILAAVEDKLWIAGEKIIVLGEEGEQEVIETGDDRTLFSCMIKVGNQIWALKGKNVQIWDIETQTLIKEVQGAFKSGNPQDLLVFNERLWISGRIGAKGHIWIMNSEFEVICEIEKHEAEVYMCKDIGPLIWSVSWDKMIYTWQPEDWKFVAPIQNFHTDAIQTIFSAPRVENDGWIVWTGSSDSTINVLFVPQNYSKKLLAPEGSPRIPVVHQPESHGHFRHFGRYFNPQEGWVTASSDWRKSPRRDSMANRRGKAALGGTRSSEPSAQLPKSFFSSEGSNSDYSPSGSRARFESRPQSDSKISPRSRLDSDSASNSRGEKDKVEKRSASRSVRLSPMGRRDTNTRSPSPSPRDTTPPLSPIGSRANCAAIETPSAEESTYYKGTDGPL